jgi:hypothetical protein
MECFWVREVEHLESEVEHLGQWKCWFIRCFWIQWIIRIDRISGSSRSSGLTGVSGSVVIRINRSRKCRVQVVLMVVAGKIFYLTTKGIKFRWIYKSYISYLRLMKHEYKNNTGTNFT